MILYAQIRSYCHSMLWSRRRPMPIGADGIGRWQSVFESTAYVSVVTNAALICFTLDSFKESMSPHGLVWLFMGFNYGISSTMRIIEALVDDIPEDVVTQLERQAYIREKVVQQAADDTKTVDYSTKRTNFTRLVQDCENESLNDKYKLPWPPAGTECAGRDHHSVFDGIFHERDAGEEVIVSFDKFGRQTVEQTAGGAPTGDSTLLGKGNTAAGGGGAEESKRA